MILGHKRNLNDKRPETQVIQKDPKRTKPKINCIKLEPNHLHYAKERIKLLTPETSQYGLTHLLTVLGCFWLVWLSDR